jgi:hypothetical protein
MLQAAGLRRTGDGTPIERRGTMGQHATDCRRPAIQGRRRPALPGLAALVTFLFMVAGCAIRLAPDFDPTILEGLTRANEQALVLYASVSSGAPKETFAAREESYNKVLGAYDSVRLQAKARPFPRPDLPPPTEGIIDQILGNLMRLRDTHRDTGLTPATVQILKSLYEPGVVQALTYERALER